MSGKFRRFLRILLCTVILVPVCGVTAGVNPTWRVRMPVILPLENLASGGREVEVSCGTDLKMPVRSELLSSKNTDGLYYPVANPEMNSPVLLASSGFLPRSPMIRTSFSMPGSRPGQNGYLPAGTMVAFTNAGVGTSQEPVKGRILLADGSSGKKQAPPMVSDRDVDAEDRYTDPSVSLFPSDNAEERQWKSSANGFFFTTPKRFLGLEGTYIKTTPALSLVEMYDSNIDYTDISDFITEITPALDFMVVGEEMNVKFNGNFIYRDYLENSKFDRYDYNVNLAGKYRVTPSVDASLALGHKRYHNLDQNTYEAGGVELDPTIVLKTTATPEVNWRITERDNIRFSNYTDRTDYERALDSDYISNTFSLVWGHVMSNEVTTFFVGQMATITYFSREIDNFKSDQTSFQGIIGIDHQFSPGLKISLKGGPGFSSADYRSDFEKGKSEDFLYQVRAELGYRELRFAIVPAIERTVRPGRYGENEIMDQVELYGRYDFSEFLKYDTINTWWLNETDGTEGGRKHKASGLFTQHIVRWEFEENWKWLVGFSYNWGRNELTGVTNERFKTWTGLSFSFPTEIN